MREPSAPVRILVWIASIVVCVIPPRLRRWWPLKNDEDLHGPAAISGLLEFLLGAPGTVLYIANSVNAAKGGLGLAGLILNPFAPAVFIFAEGAVRFLAAISSGQILPTLPLQIIVWIQNAMDGKEVALQLGPLVPDEIERGKGMAWDLRVLSCRAKPHWNPYMTIRFEGAFYQMSGEDIATGPRKFVYLLRKHPGTRLVVVVFEYDPRDVMTPDAPPRRWKP